MFAIHNLILFMNQKKPFKNGFCTVKYRDQK